MDVTTFFKEYDRMCKYYKIEWDCGSCPLVTEITDLQGSCFIFLVKKLGLGLVVIVPIVGTGR